MRLHVLDCAGSAHGFTDTDGVYDPCRANERLRLGMNGDSASSSSGNRARMHDAKHARP